MLSDSPFARAIVIGVIGGTISELSGDKFANGAGSAVFAELFNHVSDEMLSATREVERLYSVEGEKLKDFVARLGKRIYDLAQQNSVECTTALGAKPDFRSDERDVRFPAIIETQDAATWSIAASIVEGYEPIEFRENVITIHSHPSQGVIARNDRLFSGGDEAGIRMGRRAPGEQPVSDFDMLRRGGFRVTPRNVIQMTGLDHALTLPTRIDDEILM